MIKSYLLQLRELQEDRTSFEQQAHKNSQTVSLRRQEDKYQAYIIGQMASQNRIIAVSQIVSLLTGPIRTLQTDFFHTGLKPAKRTTEDKSVTSIGKIVSKKQCDESAQHSDSMTVDFMLVKMCSKLIIRYAEKSQLSVLQQSFSEIKEYSKRKLLMQKLSNNLSRYHWRVGLQAMRGIEKKHEHSCDTIFNDSFSMIAKQDRIKRPNAEESYMSFMVEK